MNLMMTGAPRTITGTITSGTMMMDMVSRVRRIKESLIKIYVLMIF